MHRPSLTAAAIVAATLIACATNPATGKKQLMLVSEAQEIAMGKAADQEAIAAYGLYPDPKVQAYVDRLGKGLAAESERPDLPWSFKVVDDPTVNAFALPGGYIYVTRGIMAHLRSEAELVAVLGHEIGHVTARHSASQMSKQQLAMGGLMRGDGRGARAATLRGPGPAGPGPPLPEVRARRREPGRRARPALHGPRGLRHPGDARGVRRPRRRDACGRRRRPDAGLALHSPQPRQPDHADPGRRSPPPGPRARW